MHSANIPKNIWAPLLWISMILSLLIATNVHAASKQELSVFKTYYNPTLPELQIASVISADLPRKQLYNIAVIEEKTGQAQAYTTKTIDQTPTASAQIQETSPIYGNKNALIDNNVFSSAEFNLDRDQGQAYLIINFQKQIASDSIQIHLSDHVPLPYQIQIEIKQEDTWKTVLNRTRLLSTVINFPEAIGSTWRITFWHSQILRLRELEIVPKNLGAQDVIQKIYWLARPQEKYLIYADAVTAPTLNVLEAGDLQRPDTEIVKASISKPFPNPLFQEPDDDKDSIINLRDNCIDIKNSDQQDLDENGRGDACEDHDGDGVIDIQDNCPANPNYAQKDRDGDQVGDVCDNSEDRLTEKLPWLPWVAIGITGIIIAVIVISTIRTPKKPKPQPNNDSSMTNNDFEPSDSD